MVNQSTVCVLLATICYLVIPSYGLGLSNSFQKCNLGDDSCIAQSFTNFIQHPDEYPDLGIPNLNPYVAPHPFLVNSFQLTPLLTASLYWTNISVYGIENAVIQEISGYQPGQSVSELQLKILMPNVTMVLNTSPVLKLILLTLKPQGSITMVMENVELSITEKATGVQRNGKDYVTISDVSVKNQVSDFKAYIHYDNAITATIFSLVDTTVNTGWKLIKPMLDPTIDRFIGEVLYEVITPIFNKTPIQDFFNMNTIL